MADNPSIDLAEAFAEVARALLGEQNVQRTLEKIVQLAVETVDNCEHAGIPMIRNRAITTAASSDEIPALVDQIQSDIGEGPCVDAINEREVFLTGRLSQEGRWPAFARRANGRFGMQRDKRPRVVDIPDVADVHCLGEVCLRTAIDRFDNLAVDGRSQEELESLTPLQGTAIRNLSVSTG